VTAPPSYHRARTRTGTLPLSTKIYQGIGSLPETYKNFAFGTLLLFYYNQVLGLPASRASVALMISLVIDALADPLVGSLSDKLHSRLGRRHSFMYASALPLGVAIASTFLPPAGLSHDGLFVWLLACAIATRVAMTFFSVPWNALYAEFSDDYAERSAIVMWRYLVGWVGGMVFVLSVWTFVFPSSPEFTPGHLNPRGYRLFAPLLGGMVALSVFLTTHLTRREIPYLLQPVAGSERPSWRGFLGDFALAATNRDFTLLFVAILVISAIAGTGAALDIYMQTYFWGLLPEDLRWFAFALAGSALAFIAIRPLQARFEKHRLLVACALFSLANGFVLVGLRFADVLPENGDARLLAILVANSVLRVAADTTAGIMFASMIADTLDAQELAVGRRQEGVFSAALSFAGKATTGIGVMIGGLLLERVIEMPSVAGGVTLDSAVTSRLGLVAGFGLPLFYLIPISFAVLYRITRERHEEIRAQLARIRG
jgi:glycoside/pentoside/hexuronide:cation symporter, GPH family